MSNSTIFDIAVKNPDAGGTSAADVAVLYAGKPNRLVVTLTASDTVTLPAGTGVLTLDFDQGFDPKEKPLAGTSITASATIAGQAVATTFAAKPGGSGRTADLTSAADLALEAGDTITATIDKLALSKNAGPGIDPNFTARWSGLKTQGHGKSVSVNIAVQPATSAAGKPLSLRASWGVTGSAVAVSSGTSRFHNTLRLYITNIGSDPLLLKGATFRISAPTVSDGATADLRDAQDALCTRDELRAAGAKPLTGGRDIWTVNHQANAVDVKPDQATLGWTLAASDDSATLPSGGSVGLQISGLVTTLANAPDFPVRISITCTAPNYVGKTLFLLLRKEPSLLTAACETDDQGRTYAGATVTLSWQLPTEDNIVSLTAKPAPAGWSDLAGRPGTDSVVVHPPQTTAYSATYDDAGRDWQSTVNVAAVSVDLTADLTATPLPGAPVLLTCTAQFASSYRIEADPPPLEPLPTGTGAVTSRRTITVHPLKSTTYTLRGDGFNGPQTRSVPITVPPIGSAGIIRYGAVDGIWDIDLATADVKRFVEAYSVDDFGLFRMEERPSNEVGWIVPCGTTIYIYDQAGTQLGQFRTPKNSDGDPEPVVGLMEELTTQADPQWGVVFVRNNNYLHRVTKQWGHVQAEGPALPPALTGAFTRSSGGFALFSGWDGVYIARRDQQWRATQIGNIAMTAAIRKEGDTLYVAYVDRAEQALYWSSDRDPVSAQGPRPARICDVRLASSGNCRGLAIDPVGDVFWFEDEPRSASGTVLCRWDTKARARTALLYPIARPSGAGLMWLHQTTQPRLAS